MFGKDPIYRTKVIVWKPVWTPTARHTQSHNTASRDGRIKTIEQQTWLECSLDGPAHNAVLCPSEIQDNTTER